MLNFMCNVFFLMCMSMCNIFWRLYINVDDFFSFTYAYGMYEYALCYIIKINYTCMLQKSISCINEPFMYI